MASNTQNMPRFGVAPRKLLSLSGSVRLPFRGINPDGRSNLTIHAASERLLTCKDFTASRFISVGLFLQPGPPSGET